MYNNKQNKIIVWLSVYFNEICVIGVSKVEVSPHAVSCIRGEIMDKNTVMNFHPPSSEELESSLYVTWAGKRKWKSGQYIGFKTVNVHVLVYVVSGKGVAVQGGSDTVSLCQGSAFIIFPGERFRFCSDGEDPWEFYWTSFDGSACQEILSTISMSPEQFVVHGLPDSASKAMSAIIEHLNDDKTDRLSVLGNLLQIFSDIGRLRGEPRKKIDARRDIVPMAVRFIESYYFMHIDVDMLCEYVQYSRSYLSRLFNNELGITIPEYINQVRINHAKELFEETLLSVQEVSASVGIIDSFYFSKTFKKLVGVSPNQYKKQFGVHARQAGAYSKN